MSRMAPLQPPYQAEIEHQLQAIGYVARAARIRLEPGAPTFASVLRP
ncbi:hypothetical protein [Couchioplanes caeruleus]|uniref:Uncharacterized protein n=1 Tax=Couchioplanes caeruleus TaxID=56438 RepID=A0A3N1GTY8_9ACTN|nr:hypothetical protein [Couchioplanes caeruleus]ROP33709.1 hypothetical protein EDD30_6744 [Couchioplanes caeruleus]